MAADYENAAAEGDEWAELFAAMDAWAVRCVGRLEQPDWMAEREEMRRVVREAVLAGLAAWLRRDESAPGEDWPS